MGRPVDFALAAWCLLGAINAAACLTLPPIDNTQDVGFEYHPFPLATKDGHGTIFEDADVARYRTGSKPSIILKLDDIDANHLTTFAAVAEYLKTSKTKASFGVIVQRMAGLGRSSIAQARCAELRKLSDSGLFELWNHGALHVPGEIMTKNLRQYVQMASVSLAVA
jgi:hypothetical protein